MRAYFGDFKLLMQRAKDFGKPVVVLMEADAFGFLQQQTGSNPSTYAAIAAIRHAGAGGLPNTVAGWGLAFLQIRASRWARATPCWACTSPAGPAARTSPTIRVTDPLAPEVDKVYNFLAPLGLAANVTGST